MNNVTRPGYRSDETLRDKFYAVVYAPLDGLPHDHNYRVTPEERAQILATHEYLLAGSSDYAQAFATWQDTAQKMRETADEILRVLLPLNPENTSVVRMYATAMLAYLIFCLTPARHMNILSGYEMFSIFESTKEAAALKAGP